MTALGRLSPRARILVALGYAAAAALTLAVWWTSLWPNVVADGVAGAPAIVATSGLLVRRVKHEVAAHVATEVKRDLAAHVDQRLAEHHEQMKAHVDRALAAQPPTDGGVSP